MNERIRKIREIHLQRALWKKYLLRKHREDNDRGRVRWQKYARYTFVLFDDHAKSAEGGGSGGHANE